MGLVSKLNNNSNKSAMFLAFIFILFFLFLWFNKSINSYFSQDDFFHLRLIMDKDITDIPWFFTNYLEGQTFYRPVSRETFNLIMYKFFGLNPLPFHIFNVLLISSIGLLLFMFIKKLSKNPVFAYFTLIIYLSSSVHSIELYYLASVQTLMATIFLMLSLGFYFRFLEKKLLSYYLSSILFFLISLFCHESVIILPGIMILINLLFTKDKNIRNYCLVVPIIALALLYLLSIGNSLSLPKQQVYQPVFQPKSILNTLSWFVLWSFGLPEMMVDFVRPKLLLKEEFKIWYGYYANIVFPMLIFTFSSLLVLIVLLKKIILKDKFLFFFVASFLICISPFLFFPQHKFVYYLSLPVVWFSAAVGLILAVSWKNRNFYKAFSVILPLTFIIISYQTINLNSTTYWAAKRAQAAQVLLDQFILKYPSAQKGSIFYILDDPSYPNIAKEWGTSSQQAFYILSGSDAVRLLYNDASIKVYYQSMENLPVDIDSNKVKKVMAKFPY